MRYLEKRLFPLLLGSLLCCACEGDTYDILDIEVPGGYELSAGTATVFMRSSKAYDTPANWVTGVYNSRFNNGDGLYDDVRTSTNGTVWALSMPDIPAAVAIITQAVHVLRCGAREDRAVAVSLPC